MAYPYLGGAVPSAVPTASTTDNVKKKVQPMVAANTSINGLNQTTQTQGTPVVTTPSGPQQAIIPNLNLNSIDNIDTSEHTFDLNPRANGSDGGLRKDVTTLQSDYQKAIKDGVLDPITASQVNSDAGANMFEGADDVIKAATAGTGVYGIRQLSYKQRQIAAMMPGRSQLSARSAALQGGGTVV